jgi:hypothetical protein
MRENAKSISSIVCVIHILLMRKKVCILKDILILYLQLVLSASFLKLDSFFYSALLG